MKSLKKCFAISSIRHPVQNSEVLKDTIRLNQFSRSAFTHILETLMEIGGEYIDSRPA